VRLPAPSTRQAGVGRGDLKMCSGQMACGRRAGKEYSQFAFFDFLSYVRESGGAKKWLLY